MQPSVTVLGAGAMGEAILRGLLEAGWPADRVRAADTSPDRAAEVSDALGIETSTDPSTVVTDADVIVVVVKPHHVAGLVETITPLVTDSQVILSVAAGVPIALYEQRLPGVPVVRAMPNTPALLGAGAAAIAAGTHAGPDAMQKAGSILGAVGVVVEAPESLIDTVTAVSGSGPAYVFLLSEAMQAAAIENGLSEEDARILVNHTIAGAGRMLTETGTDASVLRERVTSPGGTTAAALRSFAADGFTEAVSRAVAAARRRSEELGRES